jgi:plasmid stability protein
MATVLTIRDVPDSVKEALARDARDRGQSLQAFLLSVLTREAAFRQNEQLLAEIDSDLATGGGADSDAPDAKTLIETARARSETTDDPRSRRGNAGAA